MNTIVHNAEFFRDEIAVISRILADDKDLNATDRRQFQRQLDSARAHLAGFINCGHVLSAAR